MYKENERPTPAAKRSVTDPSEDEQEDGHDSVGYGGKRVDLHRQTTLSVNCSEMPESSMSETDLSERVDGGLLLEPENQ